MSLLYVALQLLNFYPYTLHLHPHHQTSSPLLFFGDSGTGGIPILDYIITKEKNHYGEEVITEKLVERKGYRAHWQLLCPAERYGFDDYKCAKCIECRRFTERPVDDHGAALLLSKGGYVPPPDKGEKYVGS